MCTQYNLDGFTVRKIRSLESIRCHVQCKWFVRFTETLGFLTFTYLKTQTNGESEETRAAAKYLLLEQETKVGKAEQHLHYLKRQKLVFVSMCGFRRTSCFLKGGRRNPRRALFAWK